MQVNERVALYRWYVSLRLYTLAAILMIMIGSYVFGYSIIMPQSYLNYVSSEISQAASEPFYLKLVSGLVGIVPAYIPYLGIGYMSYNLIVLGEAAPINIGAVTVQAAILIIITIFPMVDGTLASTMIIVDKLGKASLPKGFLRSVVNNYALTIIISLVLFVLLMIMG